MTSSPFIHLFTVQFLLTGPYGQYKPADGAEEQFNLVAVHKKLNLCY